MSMKIGVIDEGIDYRHPDLYQNIWINRGEIPAFVNVAALDLNRDGQLSYRELNDPQNAGLLASLHRPRRSGYLMGHFRHNRKLPGQLSPRASLSVPHMWYVSLISIR